MNETTIVRGDGVAAACCVRSLAAHEMPVLVGQTGHSRLSAILLSEATQSLLTDLFADPQLFRGMPRITKRVVAWGPGTAPVILPHSAIAISERELLDRLWASSPKAADALPLGSSAWEIISTRTQIPQIEERRFGSRTAFVSEVSLADLADRQSCWIESLDEGWLFLFPVRHEAACLISVGGPASSLIAQSRLIAAQIKTAPAAATEVPAYPRILSQLCGPGWLACGSAAMGFDPLCGEGAANAVREAILASAVVHAASRNLDRDGLLAHYDARLTSGFLRHLQMCQHFYTTGGTGLFWRSELQLLQQGVAWLSSRLQPRRNPRFRLAGFELMPL